MAQGNINELNDMVWQYDGGLGFGGDDDRNDDDDKTKNTSDDYQPHLQRPFTLILFR